MIRNYAAPTINATSCSLGGSSVETHQRQLGSTPARLHFSSARHALFLEMSEGMDYERRIDRGPALRIRTRPETVSFRPAGAEVTGWSCGAGLVNYAVVFIDPEAVSGLDDPGLPRRWAAPTCVDSRAVWAEAMPLIDACRDPANDRRPLRRFYGQGRLVALLATLAEQFGDASQELAPVQGDHRLVKVINFLQEGGVNDFDLVDLAEIAHVTPSTLIRIFKKATGMTPMAYASHHRITMACRLIDGGRRSIAEIAAELGYCDQSHFSRKFKKATGLTPAQYRKRCGRTDAV